MRQCWDRMDGYMSLNRIAWLAFIASVIIANTRTSGADTASRFS